MERGAALEDRQMLKRPWLRDNFPVGVVLNHSHGITEIGFMVRAKMEPRPLPFPLGGGGQEGWLEDPILVMAAFWPGIREEQIDCGESRRSRQCLEKIERVGVDEMEVSQLGSVTLAISAYDSVEADIHTDA